MFEPGNEDILEYCFGFMISKEQLLEFLQRYGINARIRSLTYLKAARRLRDNSNFNITLDQTRLFMRDQWPSPNVDMYMQQLESGILDGHDWHRGTPGNIHYIFQNLVRSCCAGTISFDEYLNSGVEIVKQEFFIVLIHDLCEAVIINNFPEVLPSIRHQSLSDFIIQGLPFDLKVSGLAGWALAAAKENPLGFVDSMYSNADPRRSRKQAAQSINNWGLNRFYVIVADPDAWLVEPRIVLEKLIVECRSLSSPLTLVRNGLEILCNIVFIE